MKKLLLIISAFILSAKCVNESEWDRLLSVDEDEPCGPDMRCVRPHLCLGGEVNKYGVTIIVPRSEECDNIKKCCKVDEIKKSESLVVDIPEPPGCGFRNSKGAYVTLEPRMDFAQFGEFPWMVAIFINENTFHCGGSLLHPRVVLTAAHRVYNRTPQVLKVRVGDWERNGMNEPLPHQEQVVKTIIVHKDFNRNTFENNIALLVLKTAFDLAEHISPICLPPAELASSSSVDEDEKCIVNGWGKTAYADIKYSNIMKTLELKRVAKPRCETNLQKAGLGRNFRLKPSHLCAGGEANVDACIGDGGSPLVCRIPGFENRYYQVGLVSAGLRCGLKDVPGVYADISYLRPWIDNEFRVKNFNLTYLP